jgi:hypothetical protein
MAPAKKVAFYELVLYPVRSAALANERFFAAELAEFYRTERRTGAMFWARRSIAAHAEIEQETKYFNETLAGAKWRFIMSPEMNTGQWPSMRSTPPQLNLVNFQDDQAFEQQRFVWKARTPTNKGFTETDGAISIEAEHFTRKSEKSGVAWQVIPGLGRTGDSVAVFPTTAISIDESGIKTLSPALEYEFSSLTKGEFEAVVYLLPTQPIQSGKGLRYAIAVDDQPAQIVTVGPDAEVSSPAWSRNVLNATTIGTSKLNLSAGKHVLKIYMIDAGVILDKIVLSFGEIRPGYFGPAETSIR